MLNNKMVSADLNHPILGAPERVDHKNAGRPAPARTGSDGLRPPEQSSDPASSVWQGLGDLSGTATWPPTQNGFFDWEKPMKWDLNGSNKFQI